MLGIPEVTWFANPMIPFVNHIAAAVSAVASGLCETVLAYHAAYRLPCIPHVFSSAVSLVANLHFIAALPNGALLEFDRNRNPLREELFEEPIEIDKRGVVALPERPGLGVTLNMHTVERYQVPLQAPVEVR